MKQFLERVAIFGGVVLAIMAFVIVAPFFLLAIMLAMVADFILGNKIKWMVL